MFGRTKLTTLLIGFNGSFLAICDEFYLTSPVSKFETELLPEQMFYKYGFFCEKSCLKVQIDSSKRLSACRSRWSVVKLFYMKSAEKKSHDSY